MINRSDWYAVHEQITFANRRSSLGSRHDRPIRGDDYGVIACEIVTAQVLFRYRSPNRLDE